jgi:hypothetical protein
LRVVLSEMKNKKQPSGLLFQHDPERRTLALLRMFYIQLALVVLFNNTFAQRKA